MDYQALVIDVLETVVTVGLPIVIGYGVKWLNVHIGTKKTELIKAEIKTVIQSLEQQAAAGKIDKDNKFYMAFEYVSTHYKDLTEDKITHLIEAAVRDMKLGPVQAAMVSSLAPLVGELIAPVPATPVDTDSTVTIQTPAK